MNYKAIENTILHEDNHLLVINKASNILVQGDRTGDESIVDIMKEFVKWKYDKPGNVFIGLAHRLDRPVSGALILCKTSKALTRINKAFKDNKVEKTYLAISEQKSKKTSFDFQSYLLKNRDKNLVQSHLHATTGAKQAFTRWHLIATSKHRFLYKVFPITGRSHQIRVHLSVNNCTILGDLKYGAKKPLKDRSIALHCYQMKLEHPVTKLDLIFTAPPPDKEHWKEFKSFLP